MSQNLIKPIPSEKIVSFKSNLEKDSAKRTFNYRLSRARRVVENVFGILSAVFRGFRKPVQLEPDKAEIIVLACIYLHNFLRNEISSQDVYSPPDSFDREVERQLINGSWR